jgi:hypothetical protein
MPQLFCCECDRETQHKSLVKRNLTPKAGGILSLMSLGSATSNRTKDLFVHRYFCRECNQQTSLENQSRSHLISQAIVSVK